MGLHKGSLRLSLGFVCFILSLVSADLLFPLVRVVAIEHINNIVVVNVVSGISAYLIAMLFFAFINTQLTNFISDISGGMIDRILGLGLGAIRGLAICWIIFSIIAIFTSDAHIGAKTAQDIVLKIKPDYYPKWLTGAISYDFISGSLKALGGGISDKTLESITLPSVPKSIPETRSEIIERATHVDVDDLLKQTHEPSDNLEKELDGMFP